MIGVLVGKPLENSRLGSPPAVNTLPVITDHRQVAVRTQQQIQKLELNVVGVLVLNNHQVAELGLQPLPSFGKPGQKLDHLAQQVGEIKGLGLTQLVLVKMVKAAKVCPVEVEPIGQVVRGFPISDRFQFAEIQGLFELPGADLIKTA